MRSTRVTIRFFVTTLTKAFLHQLLSMARRPAQRRVLVVSNVFHWGSQRETTCFCDPSMKQKCFLNYSPDVWLDANCFWALQTVLLTPGLGFCSDMHYQLLDISLRHVCLSKSYPFNWICHRLKTVKVSKWLIFIGKLTCQLCYQNNIMRKHKYKMYKFEKTKYECHELSFCRHGQKHSFITTFIF